MKAIACAARTTTSAAALCTALAAGVATAAPVTHAAAANRNLALAEQYNCLACHSVNHRLLAPSFREIAARYANQPGALERLQRKIIEGGVGVWGNVQMPANTQISDEQAAALAKWILSLR